MTRQRVRGKDVFVFDLDGTVYVGERPVEGVPETVGHLRERGASVAFVSNNSSAWKDSYTERLSSMGIAASEAEVVLSTDSVLSFLAERGVTETYVVGTEAMRAAFDRHGIDPTADRPSHVVVGFDRELTYAKVRQATLHLQDGAEFVAAHPDRVCPTPEGDIPDCGAITALLETATGRSPDRVLGKPDPAMLDPVYERTGATPEDVVVVGDRLSTDIELAEAAGVDSVLVLSGDTSRDDLRAARATDGGGSTAVTTGDGAPEPDLVLDRASALLE